MKSILFKFWFYLGPAPLGLAVGLVGLGSLVVASVQLTVENFVAFSGAWGLFSFLAFVTEWSIRSQILGLPTEIRPRRFSDKFYLHWVIFATFAGLVTIALYAIGQPYFAWVVLTILSISGLVISRTHMLNKSIRGEWAKVAIFPFSEAAIRLFLVLSLAGVDETLVLFSIPLGPVITTLLLIWIRKKRSSQLSQATLPPNLIVKVRNGLPTSTLIATLGVGFSLLTSVIFTKHQIFDQSLIDSYNLFRPAAVLLMITLQGPVLIWLQSLEVLKKNLKWLLLASFLFGTGVQYGMRLAISIILVGPGSTKLEHLMPTLTEISSGIFSSMVLGLLLAQKILGVGKADMLSSFGLVLLSCVFTILLFIPSLGVAVELMMLILSGFVPLIMTLLTLSVVYRFLKVRTQY